MDLSNVAELVNRYHKLKMKIGKHRVELDRLKMDADSLENEIYAILDSIGLQSVKVGDITAYKRNDLYISVNRQKEEEAIKWLQDNGFGYLVKPSVNSRSLTAAIKETEDGEGPIDTGSLPVDLFNVALKYRVGLRSK